MSSTFNGAIATMLGAQYAGTPTGTGKALPACLARALAPMAPPQSVIHQIIQEDDLLAADRARNVNKAERYYDAAERRDLVAQINNDAAINNYGSGRGTL